MYCIIQILSRDKLLRIEKMRSCVLGSKRREIAIHEVFADPIGSDAACQMDIGIGNLS